MNNLPVISQKHIESQIFTIRGLQVMIDRDLAEMYQVETKVLNQAVKRNSERFPIQFRFQLTENEKTELVTICDRFDSLTHIARQPEGMRAYTRLSGFRSFCLCTTDFILVKGRCLMPRVSNNCFNFCSGREHFFTDISCSALL